MTSNPSWNFPSNNCGEIIGIAASGVETFKGTPIKSLAREICQNSIDAILNDTTPTRIEFKTFEITPNDIPDFSALKDVFDRALSFWSIQQSEKAKVFFNNAIKISNQPKIRCLRISDFNTTGLLGSDEEYNSPWCNLTKSQGTSDKSGSNGGSFGIGKFAPYACSDFRTVFYSTLDSTGIEAYQGIARLTSFKDEKGTTAQGIGFYGNPKNSPAKRQYSIDHNFQIRTAGNSGTDIYIIGFNGDTDWESKIVASILDGFLYAIYSEKLEVAVENTIINKNTLPELMISHKSFFEEHADEYYTTLISETKRSPLYEREIEDLGKVSLCLMIETDYHRRVAMVRKTGMKIMDKGNISGWLPFAGVLFIEGNELNKFLRELENPQHTKWEIERAENKTKAKHIINLLTKFIKESLNSLKDDDIEEALDPSVGEYLAADEPDKTTSREKIESVSNIIQNIQTKTVMRSTKSEGLILPGSGTTEFDDETGKIIVDDIPGEGGTSSDTNSKTGSDGGRQGTGSGNGNSPIEHKKNTIASIPTKTRIMCNNKTKGEYRISITPSISATNGFIDLYMSAESQNYNAEIISATCTAQPYIQVTENRIKDITFTKATTLQILVVINYHDYCSMEVRAYGNKI